MKEIKCILKNYHDLIRNAKTDHIGRWIVDDGIIVKNMENFMNGSIVTLKRSRLMKQYKWETKYRNITFYIKDEWIEKRIDYDIEKCFNNLMEDL